MKTINAETRVAILESIGTTSKTEIARKFKVSVTSINRIIGQNNWEIKYTPDYMVEYIGAMEKSLYSMGIESDEVIKDYEMILACYKDGIHPDKAAWMFGGEIEYMPD